MGLGLSASTIKSWFQYRCERKTRYELMDQVDRAAVPVIQDDREKPWADLGVDYEKRVLGRLGQQTRILSPGAGEDGLSERVAAGFFRGDQNAEYASQLNLKPRTRPQLLSSAPNVRLRRTYADLVRCDRSVAVPIFRVIDIKATRAATAFHKTQVAFYARMLESVLNELGVPYRIDPTGSIWRIPDEGTAEGDTWHEDDFVLAPYLRLVDDFCDRTLPTIAAKNVMSGLDETFFHIYFKCEQCAYLPHCIRTIAPALPPSQRNVSAVPGLTHEAKRMLEGSGVRSVEQLARAAGLRRMDGAGWSLARRAETLVARAEALRRGEVLRAPEPHSFLMPPRSDVALYLVADHDPIDDTLVTLGYMKVENGVTTEIIEVMPTASRSAEANALVKVFAQLITDL
jgi:predicted RecB family nuclease